jgi:DNA modification methylase
MATLSDLKQDHKNARKRTETSASLLKESLQRYGPARSIVIDEDDRILAGNGTVEAALNLGIEGLRIVDASPDEIIAVRRTGLTEDQKVGLALADNRTADLAEWDAEMLQQLSKEHDISPWFDDHDVEALLEQVERLDPVEGNTDPDDAPEPPAEPTTKPGDLWILGNHRLLCGDSTNPQHVERLMDGQKADMVFTDPPYGIQYDESWRKAGSKYFGGSTDHKVANDHIADWKDAFALMNADVAYVWHDHRFAGLVFDGLTSAGYEVKQQIVWMKPFGIMSRQDYNWQHECAWYAVKKGASHIWAGDKKQTTVWPATVPNHPMTPDDDARTIHPTQKPVDLAIVAIQNHQCKLVLDIFGGSGTTLIACEKTNRHCRMMELDPAYCDVIVKRWEDFTGNTAVCIPSETHFNDAGDEI